MERCLGEEEFYLEMVDMTLADDNFEKLISAVEAGDKKPPSKPPML